MRAINYIFWALLYARSFVGNALFGFIAFVLLILGTISLATPFLLGRPWIPLAVLGILAILLSLFAGFIIKYVSTTNVEENCVQGIMREGKLYLFVIEAENRVLDANHNVKVPTTDEELERYRWPDRKVVGGQRWYWSSIEKILEIPWDFISAKKAELGVVKRTEETAKNLYLGVYPYGVKIEDDQFVDVNGVPILLELQVPGESRNPYTQWIGNRGWFTRFHGLEASSLRDWVNGNDYNVITRHGKREIGLEIVKWLKGFRPHPNGGDIPMWTQDEKNVLAQIETELGVHVVEGSIAVEVFIESEKYRQDQAKKYQAEREADAVVARATGFAGVFNQLAMARFAIDPKSENPIQQLQTKLGDPIFVAANKEGIEWVQEKTGWQQAITAGVFKLNAIEGLQPGGLGLEAAMALFKTIGGDLGGGNTSTQGGGQNGGSTGGGSQPVQPSASGGADDVRTSRARLEAARRRQNP